jgi:hypothetical protein
VLTLGTLGTPTAPLGWTMLVSVAVVAALSGAVAVFGMVALVSAYRAWEEAKRRRLQAYAAVQAKCPASRTPPAPTT